MATERSQPHYPGLLVPDQRVTLWEAESSYDEASPIPGVPVPQQDTGLVLKTSGEQDDGEDLVIRTLRGGFPGPDGATFTWLYDSDDSDEHRGWDPPSIITGWTHLIWTDGTAAVIATRNPHVITLQDGTVVAIYDDQKSTEYRVRVQVMDPSAGTWGDPVSVWERNSSDAVYPCLMLLPSGRIMAYAWVEDDAADLAQVRAWYSDDDGASWAVAQSYCLREPVSTETGSDGYYLGRLRATYVNGTVLLMAEVQTKSTSPDYNDVPIQYASRDLGLTFDQVSQWDGDTGAAFLDVVTLDGTAYVFYISAVTAMPAFKAITSAYLPLDDVTEQTPSTSTEVWGYLAGSTPEHITYGDLSAVVDDQGTIYLYGRQLSTASEGVVIRSGDGGDTWEDIGFSSASGGTGTWYDQDDSSTYVRNFAATASRGRVVMLHQWGANPGNEDSSMASIFLGGYSMVTMPGYQRFARETKRVGWERTWLPFDIPDACGWSVGGTGGTITLTDGYMSLTTSSQVWYYYRNPTISDTTESIIARATVDVVSGGSTSTDAVSIIIRADDGTDAAEVRLRMTTSQIVVYDAGASANLTTIEPGDSPYEILVALGWDSDGDPEVQVWTRVADNAADRAWEVYHSALTADSATGTSTVQFGHGASTSSATKWYEFHYTYGAYAGYGLHNAYDNPDDLTGRPMASSGTVLPEGLMLRAADGAAIRADEWDIDTDHRYPVERIFDAQPRVPWRSTDTSATELAFQLTDQGDTSTGSDVVGIGLYGTNIPQFVLYGYDDGTSSWVSLGTFKAHEALEGLTYTREGDMVRPSGSSTDEPFLELDELAGGYVADTSNGWSRTIARHNEGKWTSSTTRQPHIILEDVDGTESASGTMALVPRSWVALVHLEGVRFSGYKIAIPAATGSVPEPPQGYWELGAVVVGPVVVFSEDYGWGRVIESTANVELRQERDGTISSRVMGPVARKVELAWTDGEDLSESSDPDGDADPAFAMASADANAEPIVARRDIAYQLEGLLRRLDGPHQPAVYLPRIAKSDGTDTVFVLARRNEHILARWSDKVRIEQVQGEALESEVVRIATITGSEVV